MSAITPEDLDRYLAEFIRSVRRKDGGEYVPSSLRSLLASVERHLKKNSFPASIFSDRQFELTGRCLQSKQKQLKKAGLGNKEKAAAPLTDQEIDVLYEKNLLGLSLGEALLNTLWLNNTIHFGLRRCQEHRDMCRGDVKLCEDAKRNEYLEYTERQTKTRSGIDTSNVRKVSPKMFSTGGERDPVAVYKIYRDKRPENMLSDDAPFYLAVNHTRKKDSKKKWFDSAPEGSNKLNTLMKTMASKANLNNDRLTNHSARKHMIQKLNGHEIQSTHIRHLSGHRNVRRPQSTEKYVRHPEPTTSTGANNVASTSKTPMNFFEGAAISGGHK